MNFQPAAANQVLKYLALAGYLLLLLKIWRSGLLRAHRWFFLYIGLVGGRLLALEIIPNGTTAYWLAYFLSLPFISAVSILAVLEVYELVLREHGGLMRLGRWAVLCAAVLSPVIAVISSGTAGVWERTLLEQLITAEQGVMVAVASFVLVLVFFLSCFPVSISRNALVHTAVFGVYACSRAGVLLLRSSLGQETDYYVNPALNLFTVCAIAVWIAMLHSPERDRQVKAGPNFSPEHERKILGHLDALNRTLLGSAKE